MEEVKYKASCPICGRNLFRGLPDSCIEGNCPKCGSFLVIHFGADGVHTITGPNKSMPVTKE